jgi:glycosyltransferase involved in cell wall biosynthesis
MPAVTVLLGVYNGAQRLGRAIESVLAQTFADFELLVIDDASQDASVRIVEQLAARDSRIRLLRNERNEGLGAVLHRGILEARADLIARMDADDVALPERLEKQVRFLSDHPRVDVLGTCAIDIDEDGRPLRERRVPTDHDTIVKLMWTNPLIHPTVMFRRDRVLAAGSYSATVRRRQDYELWFRCVRAGLGFANLPEPLLRYQVTPATLRRNDVRAMWHQAKIGLKGCRMIGAPPLAYVAVSLPLLEAVLPNAVRMRLASFRKRFDPRHRG